MPLIGIINCSKKHLLNLLFDNNNRISIIYQKDFPITMHKIVINPFIKLNGNKIILLESINEYQFKKDYTDELFITDISKLCILTTNSFSDIIKFPLKKDKHIFFKVNDYIDIFEIVKQICIK